MVELRVCLECKEKITGRSDKKFCSDQCRNDHNNKLNSDSNKIVRNINNILRKNRRVLSKLNPNGKKIVSRDKLIIEGFNFFYYTNTYINKKGETYFFCYEYGYVAKEENKLLLVMKEEYVA